MASQDDISELNIDQEVDAFVGKKKRKMSEGQLKALAEGRKRRWGLKADSGLSTITPLDAVEEKSSSEISDQEEAKSEGVASASSSSEDDQLSNEQSDSDASDVSADSYSSFDSASTGDSVEPQESEVNEPQTPPNSPPVLRRESAMDSKDVRAAAKMKKYIEKHQQAARASAFRHLLL